jgi:hypothetical protein
MSSSLGANANRSPASSASTVSSAANTASRSSAVSSETEASMRTCAREPAMSSGHRRWSNGRLTV